MLRSLPLILLTTLALGASASPASAGVLTAAQDDPAERPDDPGRDIRSISTTYDGAGAWRVSVRFYGAPSTETSALMRVYLGERASDGTCEAQFPNVMLSFWTDPQDRGGKVTFESGSVNLVKRVDEDSAGATFEVADERLSGRAVCGLGRTTLSRSNDSFDSVAAFEFPGAPADPAPDQPAQPAPGAPGADTVAPTASMRVLREPKRLRRGIVRVSVLAASERMLTRASLYGPGGVTIDRRGETLVPGKEIRLTLRLGARRLARLRRSGRLPVEVVTLLIDDAGNRSRLRKRTTLRLPR